MSLGGVVASHRRLRGAVGSVVVLVVTTVGAAQPRATTSTPSGYRIVAVKNGGVRIAVPDAWAPLDLTRKPLKYYVRVFAGSHPKLAEYFGSDVFSHDVGLPYTDLFAADASSDAPTPDNVRIEHYRQPQPGSPVDHQRELRDVTMKMGGQDVKVARTRVAGRSGVVASAFLASPPYPVHMTSYFVDVRPSVWYVVVFITRDDPQQDDTVQTMINSFEVAP